MLMDTATGLIEASGYADKMKEAIAKLPDSAEKNVLSKLCASVRADIDYFLEQGELFDNTKAH